MREIYIATDGTRFSDYCECLEYEREHITETALVMLDRNFNTTKDKLKAVYLMAGDKSFYYFDDKFEKYFYLDNVIKELEIDKSINEDKIETLKKSIKEKNKEINEETMLLNMYKKAEKVLKDYRNGISIKQRIKCCLNKKR